MPLQIPPAVGSSGQFVETAVVTSSQNRHVMVLGDGVSTAYAPVTSSAGALVNVSSGTFTLSSAPTVISTATTITSGTVTVSNPTTAVNVANSPTVLTASSGYLVRSLSSGTVTLSSAAALSSGVVTLSSVHTFTLSSATSLSSGTVTLSSAPLVIVASSGGTIPVTLSTVFSLSSVPTVTATAATNPWSSAPGFNMPVVNVSSGLVQISGTVTVLNTSSGVVQAIVTGSSGVGAIVTSSGALLVSGTPGSVSTAVNILGSTGTMAVVNVNGVLYVADVGSRIVKGTYKVATSYIAGAAATQVLLGIVVTTSLGSASTAKSAAIKDIKIDTDSTAANLNFFMYEVLRGTTSGLPANGQTLVPQRMDTVTTSAITVLKVLSSVLSSTLITSGALWTAFAPRPNTMVGMSEVPPLIFGREGRESDDLILRAGETLFVCTTVANVAGMRHTITVTWDEFTSS